MVVGTAAGTLPSAEGASRGDVASTAGVPARCASAAASASSDRATASRRPQQVEGPRLGSAPPAPRWNRCWRIWRTATASPPCLRGSSGGCATCLIELAELRSLQTLLGVPEGVTVPLGVASQPRDLPALRTLAVGEGGNDACAHVFGSPATSSWHRRLRISRNASPAFCCSITVLEDIFDFSIVLFTKSTLTALLTTVPLPQHIIAVRSCTTKWSQ
mmetsp:Transcript_52315/g.134992  ORF Transcript_52315/g.134992 Transcript_52315/m.134992 type:complete len:217 (+) Transcript_52315:418-1068(+)